MQLNQVLNRLLLPDIVKVETNYDNYVYLIKQLVIFFFKLLAIEIPAKPPPMITILFMNSVCSFSNCLYTNLLLLSKE